MVWFFSRLGRRLRSRRLAVTLIFSVIVYSAIGTVLPEVLDFSDESILAGLLGLRDPFSAPLFLALVFLLSVATAACAWERLSVSVRTFASWGRISRSRVERIEASPDAVIDIPSGIDGEQALAGARTALESLGMRTLRGGRLVEAVSHRLGIIGSPLFHIALAILFFSIAAGQLTRSEGLMNIVVGDVMVDTEEAYVEIQKAPLFAGRFTGLEIGLVEFEPNYIDEGGEERGLSPHIELYREGVLIKEQWVYPNNPLRHGSLIIHAEEVAGPAMVAMMGSGDQVTTEKLLFEADVDADTVENVSLEAEAADGTTVTLRFEPAENQRVTIQVLDESGDVLDEQTVAADEPATVPVIGEIVPLAFTSFVQLRIVNDWSVPWIYASFVLAAIGMVLALLYHSRTVWVLADSDNSRLLVAFRVRQLDPAFPGRVIDAVTQVIDGLGPDETEGDGVVR